MCCIKSSFNIITINGMSIFKRFRRKNQDNSPSHDPNESGVPEEEGDVPQVWRGLRANSGVVWSKGPGLSSVSASRVCVCVCVCV